MNSVPPLEPSSSLRAGPPVLAFGPWQLDRRSGELRDGTRTVRLQEQPLRVLELLVLRAGEVVTRDELIAHVWPRGVIIDFDTGINTAIRKLRSVLGDDAEAPRFIETLPRRGYRLIGTVAAEPPRPQAATATPDPAATPAAPSPVPSQPPGPVPPVPAVVVPRRRWLPVALAALLPTLAVTSWLLWPASTAPVAGAAAPAPAEAEPLPRNAIAVLPFRRLGDAAMDETLARGLAESVLHTLSASPDLVVIARASSFNFAQADADPTQVGRTLNARYLLDGTLQTEQDRLRLTTRLLDAEDGRTLWSLRFDRRVADVFALQDEIANQVARLLRATLAPGALAGVEGQGTQDVDAYLQFLQGRNLTVSRRVADLREAELHLRLATERDPGFAAAFAELSRARELLLTYDPPGDVAAKKARWAQAQATARRALELAPRSASSLVAVGGLSDDPRALRDYLRRAIAINPNHALAWQQLAEHFVSRGIEDPEALPAIDAALRLNPLEPRLRYLRGLYQFHTLADPAAAEHEFQAALRTDPEYYAAHARLAQIDGCCTGRLADAVRHAEQALALDPQARWVQRLLVGLYLDLGDVEAARDVARASGHGEPGVEVLLQLWAREVGAATRRLLDPANSGLLAWSEGRELRFLWRVPLIAGTGLDAAALAGLQTRAREHASDPLDPTPVSAPERLAARVDLGALLQRSGDPDAARREFAAVIEASASGTAFARGWPETRAVALALAGRRDEALRLLDAESWTGSWPSWWYYAELEPAFEPLRKEPRFIAWVARQRELAAAERTKLHALRAAGAIPQRPATTAS